MKRFDINQDIKRQTLLKICADFSGEYLLAHHGKGSFATTYSNEFIEAATTLWKISLAAGLAFPQSQMSKDFMVANITTCRGAKFTIERVDYLYQNHIQDRLTR